MPAERAPSVVYGALAAPVARGSALRGTTGSLVRAWNGGGRLGPENPVRPGLRSSQPQLQGDQQREMIC
eukprot:12788381-Alexandrium_andersonii.AAC.1